MHLCDGNASSTLGSEPEKPGGHRPLVGVDRTTIGKWERDESTPHPNQRPAYAEALGITLSELAAMLSSLPTPDGNDTPEWLSTYLGMEQSAIELRAHEPEVVYGLFQTPRYTEETVRKVGLSDVSESYVQKAVNQRRHRQLRIRDGSLVLGQDGPVLRYTAAEWQAFIAGVKAGEFD